MWNILRAEATNEYAYLWVQTKHEHFTSCLGMTYQFYKNSKPTHISPIKIEKEKLTGFSAGADVKPGDRVTLERCRHSLLSAMRPSGVGGVCGGRSASRQRAGLGSTGWRAQTAMGRNLGGK